MGPEYAIESVSKAEELRNNLLRAATRAYDYSEGRWGLSGKQLARWLEVNYHTAKYHLDQLEEGGFIERIAGTWDYRPTTKGRAHLAGLPDGP